MGRQVVTRLELYMRTQAQEQEQRVRQRIERALATERCFVAATLDSIPALVAVLDTAGRLVRMNKACAHLTGLITSSSVGKPFVEEVLQPEDRNWVAAKLREAALGQVSGPHETAWKSQPVAIHGSMEAAPAAGDGGHIGVLARQGQKLGHVLHDVLFGQQKFEFLQAHGIALHLGAEIRFHGGALTAVT